MRTIPFKESLLVESDRSAYLDRDLVEAIVATFSGKILRRKLKSNGEPENIPMYPYEITTRLSDLSLLDFSSQTIDHTTTAKTEFIH